MRIFWAVIVLLVVGTAGLVLASAVGGRAPSGPEVVVSPGVEAAPAASTAPTPLPTAVPAAVPAAADRATPGPIPAATPSPAESIATLPPAVVEAETELGAEVPRTSGVATSADREGSGAPDEGESAASSPSSSVSAAPGGTAPDVLGPNAVESAVAAGESGSEAPAPAAPIDPAATRAAVGLLANVINQSRAAPGADFIGRLAAAGNWQPAPDVLASLPEANRAFRVRVGASQLRVGDDGSGNNVTILIDGADADLAHALLSQMVGLEPLAGAAASEVAGAERFGVVLAGVPAGVLTVRGAPGEAGASGLSLAFVASPAGAVAVVTPAAEAIGPSEVLSAVPSAGEPELPEAASAAPDEAAPAAASTEASIGEPRAPAPVAPGYTIQEDGSIRLDTGAVIRGRGTPERPYEVSWELLVSAERVYQPRNGLSNLPGWCRALHEKHVRLTGHLLSPLMMDDTDQILLMRNQWDGCCVGVPPTPYDAVEVQLLRPISLVREQLNYGTITGVFEVDPYLVNNWLVGLYMLSDAKVEAANAQNWELPPVAPN